MLDPLHITIITARMERLRNILKKRRSSAIYEPLNNGSGSLPSRAPVKERFSWPEYGIFLLLGISMLWAW